ncbi:MAG: TonB-dependent receptor [Deltaproteobacteria bacterium]|nr:TonB-dependent receptor [Deltaproteobacteria bacterium]
MAVGLWLWDARRRSRRSQIGVALGIATCIAFGVGLASGERDAQARPAFQLASQPTSQPTSQTASQPTYQTVVHGRPIRRRAPADDPAAFATRIEIDPTTSGDLPALLAEIPGAHVRDYGGGQPQVLTLRGAESHRVVIYLDDVRLTSPGGSGIDLALFDAGNLAAVEVRRSAGSVRYGTGALGGAVILETRRLRRRRRTRLFLGYGSWNSLIARASHGGAWGRARLLASASYRRSDGDFPWVDDLGRVLRRVNNDSQIGEALLKADVDVGAWRLALLDSALISARGMPGPFAGREDTRQGDGRNVIALSARRLDLGLSGSVLRFGLHHRYQALRFSASRAAERSRNDLHSAEARATYMMPMGAWGRLDASAEVRGEFFLDRLDAAEGQVGDHTRIIADTTVGAQFSLLASRLRVVPALRLASASDFGVRVLPKFGAVLGLWRRRGVGRLDLLANIGRSVRYPSFSELYARYQGIRGNPALVAEDALSIDGGLRFALPWLAIEAAVFRRWLNDAIRFVQLDALSMGARNLGRVDVRGIEAAVEVRPWRCLAFRGAYTFTATHWGARGYGLPGQPRHVLAARLAWEGPRCGRKGRGVPTWLRALRLYARVTVQGEMVLGAFDTSVEEARTLLFAGGSYRFGWLTLSAEGRNLLDKRDAVDVLGFPLPPARFFVSASAGF